MITVCYPFYPWYRGFDRSDELINVAIPAMRRCERSDELVLSVADGGIRDVWGLDRVHDPREYEQRLLDAWKGPMIYSLTPNGITPSGFVHEGKVMEGRVWIARLVEEAVMQAATEAIFINNIDIELPVDFVDRFEFYVAPGKAWFPRCYHIHRLAPADTDDGGFRQATGLVGITKLDYVNVGGTDYKRYIKNRHDTDLYNRCNEKLSTVHENCPGLIHRDHPGSCERNSEFSERGWLGYDHIPEKTKCKNSYGIEKVAQNFPPSR